ncbi:MAG: hypothetical protein ABJG68_13685 [Crocinitomicaceae bacterium]
MKKLLFVAVAISGMMLVSCNKNQAAVKKLDGSWTVTSAKTTDGSFTYDGVAAGDYTQSMTFTACKLKTDEWCTMSSTTTWGNLTDTESDVFRVTGDGMTLESKDDDTSSTIWSMTINELTKSEMTATSTDGSATTVIMATKN